MSFIYHLSYGTSFIGQIDKAGIGNCNLVFEPEWDKDMMSEEAKLELGFL